MLRESDLHNYQRACARHIINNPFCGLFLEMGLGKTVSTLTAINELIFNYLDISRVLVIAPKRVVLSVWAEEARKWEHLQNLRFSKVMGSERERIKALNEKAHIYVTSRDHIAWLCAYYGAIYLPFDMVVIDELSSFKSIKAVRFKALRQARPSVKRVVGLTGTPTPNGLMDLWAQIYLLDRGERLGHTITSYRQNYFRPAKTNGHIVFKYEPFPGSQEIIQSKIADICISMKAEDYLELPECVNNYINVVLPPEVKAAYDEFEKEKVLELYNSLKEKETISVTTAATLANKLLQFSNGFVYTSPPTGFTKDRKAIDVHSAKLEALESLIDELDGKPILLAWAFQHDRDVIMRHFAKLKPRELKTKKDIDDWNAGRIKLLLAHPASAGHGLNLQRGGNTVIWYGLNWSLELYQQFNARLNRQGQKNQVIIHHLVCEGTHDADVIKALKNKGRTQDTLMESIKAKISKYLNARLKI